MANLSQVDQQVDVIDVDVLQFENLYPVLLQTFVVIVLGYVALHYNSSATHIENRNPLFSFINVLALCIELVHTITYQPTIANIFRYLSGRWGIIGQVESKGLNTFVGNFALPCIIFTALAELDFR